VRFRTRYCTVAIATSLVVVACHGDRHNRGNGGGDDVSFAVRDTTQRLGPGDVRISSIDTSFEVALIGDTVRTGFGKRILDEIGRKTDTAAVEGKGMAASIEKFVKSTVAGAMNHELLFPVSSISDIRVDDRGRLEFIGTNGSKLHILESSRHNDKVNSTFRPEDAQRFIDAFHARKGK
jgi:hypothetical protein